MCGFIIELEDRLHIFRLLYRSIDYRWQPVVFIGSLFMKGFDTMILAFEQ